MVALISYHNVTTAILTSQKLRNAGLSTLIKKYQGNPTTYTITIGEEDLEKAQEILNQPTERPKGTGVQTEEYTKDIPKALHLGRSLSQRLDYFVYRSEIWKYLASVYLLCGLGIITFSSHKILEMETLSWATIFMFIGFMMLWTSRK